MNFKLFLSLLFTMFIIGAEASIGSLRNKTITFIGTNSQHGTYKGEIEFRETKGMLSVTRVMTYDSFQFENLTVQEVWTGTCVF